jgi:hypothetical protein
LPRSRSPLPLARSYAAEPFEYLLALVSILVGLAIADPSVSVHRLLRARRSVRWDWIPLASALLVTLSLLNFWWGFYQVGQHEVWTHYWSFLVLASYLVTLFLLASAALPDDVPDIGFDLREYYRDNHRYFWSLFAVSVVFATVIMILPIYDRLSAGGMLGASAGNIVLVAALLSLARVRSRTYHGIVIPLLILLLVTLWWRMRLV